MVNIAISNLVKELICTVAFSIICIEVNCIYYWISWFCIIFSVIRHKCIYAVLYSMKKLFILGNTVFYFIIKFCSRRFWQILKYMGIHKKGSEDVVSAVCYTKYTISLNRKHLRRHLPNPFCEFSCRWFFLLDLEQTISDVLNMIC